ncbi:MAG: MraY family glycosyltransferase [Candidatus Omnitrophica bacterium]|nr:MraY family glycosyltransferase [Candidatus Omnitrophota bacterium]
MKSFIVGMLSFIIALIIIPIIRKLAFKFEILDYPGGRKIHKHVTPLLGGLGIYLAVMVALISADGAMGLILPILIGSTLIFVLGLIEDVQGLSAQIRFVAQLIITLGMIFIGGLRIEFLPNNSWGNIVEVVLTIFWLVGLTNAYNYLDGLDGLAAGSAVINLFFFLVILYNTGQYSLGILAISLIGGCLAFLPYNLDKKNKIFLGEAGSTFLGFTLASLALQGSWAHDSMVRLFIPILILGVPIFDMVFTTIMRIKEEKVKNIVEWLEYGGKDHFHHYLVDAGLAPLGAVFFIYAINLSLGISSVMLSNDTVIEGLLSLYQAAIIFGVIATLMVVGKRHRSGWGASKVSQGE